MDPETQAAFSSIGDRLDRLAEGQERIEAQTQRTDEQLVELEKRADKTDELLNRAALLLVKLTDEVSHLAAGQDELRRVIQDLGARMDGYTQAVLRGLTESVTRDSAIEKRVARLEERVGRIEKEP